MSLRDRTAIVGIGETDYSRDSGRTELQLTLQAILAALDDAGLEPHDVDGLMRWTVDTSGETEVASNLGVPTSRTSARSARQVMSARHWSPAPPLRSWPGWRTWS